MRGCAIVTGVTLTPCKPNAPSSPFQFPTWASNTSILIPPNKTNRNRYWPQLRRLNLCRNVCDEGFGCVLSSSPQAEDDDNVDDNSFIVVNFYHFVFIKYPEEEVSKHLSFSQGLDIRGRIYLNEQGINAQAVTSWDPHLLRVLGGVECYKPNFWHYLQSGCHMGNLTDATRRQMVELRSETAILGGSQSSLGYGTNVIVEKNGDYVLRFEGGPSKDALAYVKWLREDHRFSDVLVQISPALDGHAFPKLKLRYKPSLVQLEGGISHLPLLDPSMRATPLTPSQWRNKLEALNTIDETSNANLNMKYILLDVRNGYEWDIGHFHGAQRPDVDCFRSTSFGLSQSEVNTLDPLNSVDKEKTNILMYCTGGIRCDVYSSILRQRGFKNLYTLMGGVSHYLKNEGPVEWVGNLFVFDSRLSLPPSTFKPEVMTKSSSTLVVPRDNSFARCYICGSQLSELRHRNCANIDCNLLFLCCKGCMNDLRGCCCVKCTAATRLRPLLPGHQRYKKWHYYLDLELQSR